MTRTVRVQKVLKAAEASAASRVNLTAFQPIRKKEAELNPLEIAEAAKADGFNQGYADGIHQARAQIEAATDDANKKVRRALAALSEAVDGFDQRETIALANIENEVLGAAFAIARSVLQRELKLSEHPGQEAIARAMQLLPERGNAIARLNPDDAATLSMDIIESATRNIQVVADPRIEPGGCIVEVGDTKIDTQLSSALKKVGDALGLSSSFIQQHADETFEGSGVTAVQQHNSQPQVAAGSDPTHSRMTSQESPE